MVSFNWLQLQVRGGNVNLRYNHNMLWFFNFFSLACLLDVTLGL